MPPPMTSPIMPHKLESPQRERWPGYAAVFDLLIVLILSDIIFLLAHLSALSSPYVVNDDVRQQLFWMQQWLDPALFKGDLLAEYARHYVPWGVKGLYWLASWISDPISFSKFLTGILFVFLSLCLYLIGLRLGGRRLAWTTLAVYWLMPFFLDNMSGGLARAFAAPLLAWFWLSWQEDWPRGMAAALLLQALFIPYVFMATALAVGLAWLAGRTGRLAPPPFPARPVHFLLLAGGAVLVGLMNFSYAHDGFGPLVSYADMVNRPEFYARGRFPMLPVPTIFWQLIAPWEFIAPFRDLGPVAAYTVCAILPLAAVWGLSRTDWRTLAARLRPLWYLLLAGVVLYLLAWVFLLKLFIPDRYLIYTINLAYCLILALGLHAALKVEGWPRNLAVLVLVAAAGLGYLRLKDVGLKDYGVYRPLYAALARYPQGCGHCRASQPDGQCPHLCPASGPGHLQAGPSLEPGLLATDRTPAGGPVRGLLRRRPPGSDRFLPQVPGLLPGGGRPPFHPGVSGRRPLFRPPGPQGSQVLAQDPGRSGGLPFFRPF